MKFQKPCFIITFIFIVSWFDLSAFDISSLNQSKKDNKLKDWLEIYYDEIIRLDNESSFQEAENLCDSALLTSWRVAFEPKEFDIAFLINTYKAIYLQDKGQLIKATNYFEKALQYFSNSTKIHQDYLSFIYPKLGNNYTRLGENQKALLIHEKMLLLATENKDFEAVVQTKLNQSIVFENLNNIDKAIEILETTVSYFKKINAYRRGIVLSNLGKYYLESGSYLKAKEYLIQSKLIFEKGNGDSYFLGGIYRSLALINIAKNENNLAKINFQKAISFYKSSKQNRSRVVAKTLLDLSQLSIEPDSILNEVTFELTKKKYIQEITKKDIYAENTFVRLFEYKIKSTPKAQDKIKYYELLFLSQEKLRKAYLFDQSKYASLNNNVLRIEEAILNCIKANKETKNEKYLFKALAFIEESKSVILQEDLIQNISYENENNYKIYLEEKRILDNLLAIAREKNKNIKAKNLEEKIKALTLDFDLTNKTLASNSDLNKKINFQDFQLKMNSKELILNFFQGENFLFWIELTNASINISKIPFEDHFISTIKQYKNQFTFQNRFNFNKDLAKLLGQLFITDINLNIKEITIISSGILDNIPFEAMIYNEKYLIQNYLIKHSFSMKLMNFENQIKFNNQQVIAFAPIFKNDKQRALLKSEDEIAQILNIYKGESFLYDRSTKVNLFKNAGEFSVLHISSHANIDSNINTSNIEFSDGNLYFDAIKHEKFNVDLLVMSACETGIGSQVKGEGSMSLGRAFAYTEIPSIISSLWKVNEESSSIIFKSFYENLKSKTIAEAIRNAKLSYINNANISEEKKLPYYWSAYIFTGKDQNLTLKQNIHFKVYVYIFVLIILTFYAFKRFMFK